MRLELELFNTHGTLRQTSKPRARVVIIKHSWNFSGKRSSLLVNVKGIYGRAFRRRSLVFENKTHFNLRGQRIQIEVHPPLRVSKRG